MKRIKHFFWILPLLLLASCGSIPLETGLTERDAHDIVVTLRENGLDASTQVEAGDKKGAVTWQVTLGGGNEQRITAWKLLRDSGLPRDKVQGLDDVFSSSGMIPTAGEEKAKLLTGLSGELTRTLQSMPGVVDARVQVVLPDENPLLDKSEQNPPTASVLLRYRGDRSPLTEAEVKSLVAKGIEGLSPDQVAVVLKKVEEHTLPPRYYGPLLVNEWIVGIALVLTCITGIASLALVFVSQRRKRKIIRLEKELAKLLAKPREEVPAADGLSLVGRG